MAVGAAPQIESGVHDALTIRAKQRLTNLQRDKKELRRANGNLKLAVIFTQVELDRPLSTARILNELAPGIL